MKQKDTNKEIDMLKDACRRHGLRMTPQRAAVYRALAGSRDHPFADAIYRKVRKTLPHISFDTVNRTLATFSEIGVVDVVEGRGDPKRFDPNTQKHHHFRCLRCNAIMDFCEESWDALKVPRHIKKQCAILNKKVVLEGLCSRCR